MGRLVEAGEPVRLELRADGGGTTVVEGTLEVEAADGGLLIARPDQRLDVIAPDRLVRRTPLPAAPDPGTARELGRRILGDLPAGFDVLATKHYIVCFDTSRSYAQWAASLFERLHEAFANYWDRAGFAVARPPQPLIVVIFADRRRYEAHAAGELGAATDRVVGYYNILTNRITTYDLTGSDGTAAAGRSPGRAGLEALARPEAAGLVSTLVHEATHQMAFNCGLHQRLAPVPVWVCEGVATYFETPDVTSDRGWRAIGGVNAIRRQQFQAFGRRGWIEPLIEGDEVFRKPGAAIDAYAQAWALTAFLIQTKKQDFVRYLQALASKRPFADDSPELRRRDFAAAFGAPDGELEEQVAAFVARLRTDQRR
jgi:hypothetical protein